jgi:hypothetical protein
LGEFSGEWPQTGGHLELRGPTQEPILDFSYSEKWYPTTDGFGFSLVTVDEHAPAQNWGLASNWRPSSLYGGSPGSEDGQPPARGPILIDEVLSHADVPLVDSIELFNPGADPVDVSGWFLSDEFANPKKYILGPNTVIPGLGFLVLNEDTSFNKVGAANRFALSAKGDSVWLFSGDGQNLTGYAHGFEFGAAPSDVSFGRYVISTGEEHFVLQTARTPAGANAGPLVGPLVISEINYHAPSVGIALLPYENKMDQYLEIQNITGAPVPLFDPARPNNTWRLREAVAYSFPVTNVVVPPGAFIFVVGFDPNRNPQETVDFRARNGISGTVALFGPWSGNLAASGASIELARPDAPGSDGNVPYISVDKVDYSRGAPWPNGADGTGLTLQRITAAAYGNDPANWLALSPTPGSSAVPIGILPTITSSPPSQVVPTSYPLLLSVAATGSTPLRYQWQANGLALSGATNSVLPVSNFQPGLAGIWNVLVYNAAGSALSAPFTLTPRTGLRILSQPRGTFTPNSTSTNLNVLIEGTGFLRYHWKFNGAEITAGNITGIDTATLGISNAQPANEGNYTCVVSDDYDTLETQPAFVQVLYKGFFVVHPLSQTAVEGGTVTFTVALTGSVPMTFRWRRGTTNIVSGIILSNRTTAYSVLTLTNLQLSDSGNNYNCVASNGMGFALGGSQVGVSSNAVLTVLADSDHDGIPDILEPLNGAADNDGDGMSNAAEYFAGTGFNDANNYLKLAIDRTSGAVLSFLAVSNRTYTLQYTDSLQPVNWQKLVDVLGRATNRVENLADPTPGARRIYRLVTPIQR